MKERIDHLDIRILEALGIHGPRSISKLARVINAPIPTVRDRVNVLKSHFSLYLYGLIYHPFVGLKKAFVFAKSTPGNERLLWECMKADEYWLFLAARLDEPESFYGIYGIPIDHTAEFEKFVAQIAKLNIAETIEIFWSTSIHTTNLTTEWYDHEADRWVFQWDKWIEDVKNQGSSLPYTLQEAQSYPQKADEIDIVILKELQKNAECKLCDIAKLLDVPAKTVQYHFKRHVIAKGLLEGYEVLLPHFEAVSDSFLFRFDFNDQMRMAKFALSLMHRPFVRSLGKILGKSSLFVRIYLPRDQFRGFTDSLARLVSERLMEKYDYVIEDLSRTQAQTISYEFFKNKTWIYDHEKHIKKLKELARTRPLQNGADIKQSKTSP